MVRHQVLTDAAPWAESKRRSAPVELAPELAAGQAVKSLGCGPVRREGQVASPEDAALSARVRPVCEAPKALPSGFRGAVGRQSVLCYFLLAYLLSWAWYVPLVI